MSGNLKMIALAKHLGFEEPTRRVGVREVNGQHFDALTFELTKERFEGSGKI